MPLTPLPVDAVIPELLSHLRTAGAAVLRAPTGAGKTTRVPQALVTSGLCDRGTVLLLEPRRVAARAAARRMAFESGTPLGREYGYHVRFDKKYGPQTRCIVVTPGILLRMLHDDPYLESVSTVIFDEFHERGIEADLALGLCKLIRESVNPSLNLIVMSATVDPGPVSRYLSQCPIITSEGRTFPVEIRYRPKRSEQSWPEATAAAIRLALDDQPGDVLAFLPGLREIRQTADLLDRLEAVTVLPLHGELPPEQQDLALRRLDQRKVVLATNVAETSVTVDGVTAVVDTGLARQLVHEPSLGMDRLVLMPISRSNADQRAGRAGRTEPGVCIRLWDEVSHRAKPEQSEPEIHRIDLAGPLLHLLSTGESDPSRFPWIDPPTPAAVNRAMELLRSLDFLNGSHLSPDGESAARLPIHPRLARMLTTGQALGVPERVALAAAILSDRDPFERPSNGYDRNGPPTDSDLLDRIEAMEEFERNGRLDSIGGRLNRGSARFVLQARDQLLRSLRSELGDSPQSNDSDSAVLQAIFAAYPDRLARRRAPNDRRAVTVGGRGVRLGPGSGVIEPELFVAIDVDGSGADATVRMASAVRREWLDPNRIETVNEVVYDDANDKLISRKRTRFYDLILDDVGSHAFDEAKAERILAEAALQRWDRVLPKADSPAGELLDRIRWLEAELPQLNLPKLDDEALRELLPQVCRGKRSLGELPAGPWLDAIRSLFTYAQLQTIDREAPSHIEVPTGSRIALTYKLGQTPILAVRIQELFGLTETPRLAGGRVPVLLHLLAPNYRPQQVTSDLASFWKNGYPIVRKDLRARYPKHSWPDDPTTAEAIRGPRKRS